VLAAHASSNDQNHVRASVFSDSEAAQFAAQFLFGLVPNAAGIDHDYLGRLGFRYFTKARLDQQTRHFGGVVLVHLTAEGDDVKRRHDGGSTQPSTASMRTDVDPALVLA